MENKTVPCDMEIVNCKNSRQQINQSYRCLGTWNSVNVIVHLDDIVIHDAATFHMQCQFLFISCEDFIQCGNSS